MEIVTVAEKPEKIHRFQIGINVLAQVLLILFLAAMVNYLGLEHYKRWDFSREQKYALSDKTKRFLDSIKGKMRITVFFSPNTPITNDVQSLLTEYQYAAKGKIDVEHIDPERSFSRAKELFDKYKVVTDESMLVLDYEGRNKTVKASEMAEVDQSGMAMGEGPRVTTFKGEQAISGAIIDLTEVGVRVNDDRLMAMVRTGIEEIARVRDVIGRFLPDSAITKRLADVRAPFLGGTCSLTLDSQRVQAGGVQLQPLVQAEKGYWGEVDYNSDDPAKLQFEQNRDHAAPLTIAVSIEKGGSGDERVRVNSSRMVVVSNALFVQDNALTQDQQALDFISGSINWLMSREQMIGIAPKVPKTLTFSLDQTALRNLRWIVLVLMPLVPALIGSAVWWKRRA